MSAKPTLVRPCVVAKVERRHRKDAGRFRVGSVVSGEDAHDAATLRGHGNGRIAKEGLASGAKGQHLHL
jgi:hypothetical protein